VSIKFETLNLCALPATAKPSEWRLAFQFSELSIYIIMKILKRCIDLKEALSMRA